MPNAPSLVVCRLSRAASPAKWSWLYRLPLAVALVAAAGGCSSSSSANNPGGGTGGPVTGALDNHCATIPTITVDPASCTIPPVPDAGTMVEFGDTMFNASGDDDDCKYHVSFTNTPMAVKINESITFKVTVKYKSSGAAATGAVNATGDGIYIESFLDAMPTHVLPNPAPVFAETPAGSGVYTATAKFDASGRWVVRFHLFGNCLDGADDSPHGHAAFFFDVP